jgi:hypothetical protein
MEENQVTAHPGREAFARAFKHLKGIGQPKDPGLAAAGFLDSSDLKYPEGILACALIYFAGVGVTRNTETASEFANEFLSLAQNARLIKIAKEIIDGSLGTQNALKSLGDLDNSGDRSLNEPSQANAPSAAIAPPKNNLKLIAGFGVLGLAVVGGAVFFMLPQAGGNMSFPVAQDPSTFFKPEEIQEAKRKALEKAGVVRTEARTEVRDAQKKEQ